MRSRPAGPAMMCTRVAKPGVALPGTPGSPAAPAACARSRSLPASTSSARTQALVVERLHHRRQQSSGPVHAPFPSLRPRRWLDGGHGRRARGETLHAADGDPGLADRPRRGGDAGLERVQLWPGSSAPCAAARASLERAADGDGRVVHLVAEATAAGPVRDPLFGVAAEALRLDRTAETYQWLEVREGTGRNKKLRYDKVWSPVLIPSERFEQRSFHANPPRSADRQRADSHGPGVRLAELELDPALVEALPAIRELRPDNAGPVRGRAASASRAATTGYTAAIPAARRSAMSGCASPPRRSGSCRSWPARSAINWCRPVRRAAPRWHSAAYGDVPAETMLGEAAAGNWRDAWALRGFGALVILMGTLFAMPMLARRFADRAAFNKRHVGTMLMLAAGLAAGVCALSWVGARLLLLRPGRRLKRMRSDFAAYPWPSPLAVSMLGATLGAGAGFSGETDGTQVDGLRRGDRGRRAVGPGGGDPPQAARGRAGAGSVGLRAGEGLGGGRAYPLRRLPGAAGAERAVPRLAGARGADRHPGHRGPFPLSDGHQGVPAADAAADAQRRQLHRQPGQRRALAGPAGGGAGGRDLPGLRRGRGALRRGRAGDGRGHRQHGRDQDRRGGRQLPARHGAAREADPVRRRLPRLAHQDADGAVQPARRRAAADLRAGHQGAVGDPPGQHARAR